MAIYSPALLLQPIGPRVAAWGFAAAAAYMIVKAVLAVTLWGVTATGYFLRPVNWLERIVAFASAALLVVEYPWTDPIGFAACLAFLAYEYWSSRGGSRLKPMKQAAE
jgi:TRAP-type uncharacterized transport system fused permease subunit